VTFTTAGYEPVTKNIADLQKTGPAILFGTPPGDDKLRLSGYHGFAWRDANTALMHFTCASAFDKAEIYRSESPDGPYQLVGTTEQSPYIDTDLKSDTTYYYKLRMTQGSRFGPLSSVYEIKTDDIKLKGYIGFAWRDTNKILMHHNCNGAIDFLEVYRAESQNGTYVLVDTSTQSPYIGVGLKPDTMYYYKLRYSQRGHFSQFTDVIEIKTDDIKVTGYLGFAWRDANTILMHYSGNAVMDFLEVYRAESPNGTYVLVETSTQSPYIGVGLKPDTTYYYKLRYSQGGHYSQFTDVIEIKTDDIKVTGYLGFAWRDANTILMHYSGNGVMDFLEVYRAESPNGTYILVGTSAESPYIDTNLTSNTTYYYKIRYSQGGHYSQFTDVIEIKTS
jgi:fibronectin type 3 domain-containing protein